MACHDYLCRPTYTLAKEIIDASTIGKVLYFEHRNFANSYANMEVTEYMPRWRSLTEYAGKVTGSIKVFTTAISPNGPWDPTSATSTIQ